MPKDELEIARQARAAAERAKKLIPQEALDAAQRLGEVGDQLRLVPRQLAESIADWIRQANEQVSELLRSVTRPVVEFVDVFRSPEMRDFIQRAQEAFTRLPAALRDILQTLGRNGWYPDGEMEMADLLDFEKGFDTGAEEKTNEALCQHFEARSEAIISDLVAMVPKRERFLLAALEAHRDQKYELSILAFLVQADGMWQEFTKASAGRETRLFSRQKGQPRTAKWVKSVKRDDLDEALLYPLVAPLPISAADEDVVSKGALVRHRVLHGTDVEYATRLNSCRALSHLGYVGSVIRKRVPTGSNSTL